MQARSMNSETLAVEAKRSRQDGSLLVVDSANYNNSVHSEQTDASERRRKRPILPENEAQNCYPYYVSASVPSLHDKLYRDIFSALLENGIFFNSPAARAEPPFKFKSPEQVKQIINFRLPETRLSHPKLLDMVNKLIEFSPKASHPFKVDRHGCGLDPYGIVGDWIATTMSNIVITYFLAPVFTLMEFEVWQRVRELIGYPNGLGDGMTVPGAGMGNAYVTQLALTQKCRRIGKDGMVSSLDSLKKNGFVIFVSEHASFSHDKFSVWQGIGTKGVIKIRVDQNGRMDVTDLELKIVEMQAQSREPVLIVATAGTPVLGAIDPIDKISLIAQKYDIWLHVDGHLAGSNFFSKNQAGRLNGIEKSDSFLWSADQGLAAPFVTSILVTRKEKAMMEAFSHDSSLVFHDHPLYDRSVWDNGDGTMQCTRRPEIVKIWFMWKAKGKLKLGQHVDHTYQMTSHTVQELMTRNESFRLILDNFDSPQVAFYYIPKILRPYPQAEREAAIRDSRYTQALKANLLISGKLSISTNTLKQFVPSFFVMRLGNSVLTKEDVNYMLDQIEIHGEDEELEKLLRHQLDKYDEPTSSQPPILQLDDATGQKEASTRIFQTVPPPPPSSYPDYVSAPIESLHMNFFKKFIKLILHQATYYQDRRRGAATEPVNFQTPQGLKTLFDFSLAGNSGAGSMTSHETQLLEIFSNIIKYSAHPGHPYYLYHMAPALDPYSLMADYVVTCINSPMLTYEDSPLLTEMEIEVIAALRKLIGYKDFTEDRVGGSGAIVPGGSAAIQIAQVLAIESKFPEMKEHGLAAITNKNKTLKIFMSSVAHYATEKGAAFDGVGTNNVVLIDQDEKGRMSVPGLRQAVEKCVSRGQVPFLVVATAGTTALGVFDPIDPIADLCQEFGMWLHVDGSYGGATLFSSNERRKDRLFFGLNRADSFNVNPHKALAVVRESAILVTRKSDALRKLTPASSPYDQEFNNLELYSGIKHDPGVYNLFTDRRSNIFKFFFLWNAKGRKGFGLHMDRGYHLTRQVVKELLERRAHSFLLHPVSFTPQSPQVNVFYLSKRLRALDHDSIEFWKGVEQVQNSVKRVLIMNTSVTLESKTDGRLPPSLIIPLYYSNIKLDDIKHILDIIDYHGQDL